MGSHEYDQRTRQQRYDPRYETQETYPRTSSHELVPRTREDSSVEEISREFSPQAYRRSRSVEPMPEEYYSREYESQYRDRRSRRKGSGHYEDGERSRLSVLSKEQKIFAALTGAALAVGGKELYDRSQAAKDEGEVQRNYLTSAALGAAGAFAAYQGAEAISKHSSKGGKRVVRDRHGRVIDEYYSDDDGRDPRKHNNSFLGAALTASGLGSAFEMLTGAGDGRSERDRGRDRDRRGYRRSRSRSWNRSDPAAGKIQKAAMASLLAGATEAFRVSGQPGGWGGEKTKRIMTAAATAAGVDAIANKNNRHNKRDLAGSVLAGLASSNLIRGSRDDIEEDRRTGRSRSRSRSRARSEGGGASSGPLAALAAAAAGFAGKKFLDGRRSPSPDSYRDRRGSYHDGRRRSRSRSHSQSTLGRALTGLGFGGDRDDRDRDHHHHDDYSRRRRHHHPHSDSDDDDDDDDGLDYDNHRSDDRYRSQRGDHYRGGRHGDAGSDSDERDSDDEREERKMKRKLMVSSALAAVTTIHAGNSIKQSLEKHAEREKATKDGDLSPKDARKLQTKSALQDLASVGLAAIAVKSAYEELQEVHDINKELRQRKGERKSRPKSRQIGRRASLSTGGGGGGGSGGSGSGGGGGGYGRRSRSTASTTTRATTWAEPY